MADILYVYGNEVYANITNLCDCRCTFCIRSHGEGVGSAETLWHKTQPTYDDIVKAMDEFDFSGFEELVYCGYGEPTCAVDTLVATAKYAKERFGLKIRLNTNGLGNLYNKRNIIPDLAQVVDVISISLNAPTKEKYMAVTRPMFDNAFEALLDFAKECKGQIPTVKLTVVDVLPKEDIEASQKLADELGIYLRIREYSE